MKRAEVEREGGREGVGRRDWLQVGMSDRYLVCTF